MPRISRQDQPGSWHHAFNRAIARRTMFERRADFRYFLAQLARAVRRGEIEVHAYCLLNTHYHLLLRSPEGRLADAMQRVQLAYSRWFNRSRRRDGSLVRGRYGSKLVDSLNYRRLLVQYIDCNPVHARLVSEAGQYRWGSARHYAQRSGPAWLERSWVESDAAQHGDRDGPGTERGRTRLSRQRITDLCELVESRMSHRGGEDPLDGIVSAVNPAVRRWMIRKSMLADGTQPGLPLLSISRLVRIIERRRAVPWVVPRGESRRCGWELALAGLGRDLCGQKISRLAAILSSSETKVHKLLSVHRAELVEETAYAVAVLQLAEHEVLQSAGLQTEARGGVRI